MQSTQGTMVVLLLYLSFATCYYGNYVLTLIPTSLCIAREKIHSSFIGNNFLQVCLFTLIIVLLGSSGCVIHSCNRIYFDIFFIFIMKYKC
jgi:hypothetical protein